MNDFLAILGALGGFKAIEWLLTFLVNRRTNSRKEKASAGSLEIKNLLDILNEKKVQVDRLEDRMKSRDEKVDSIYIELRKEQTAHLDTIKKLHEAELENKLMEVKRCDVRKCVDRRPPSDF